MIYSRLDERNIPPQMREERGFALLVALLAIVGLTALATGGFLIADSEEKTSENYASVVEAFYVAEMGLNDFLGSNTGLLPSTWSSTYANGSVNVSATRIATTGGSLPVYDVSSTGTYQVGGNAVTRTVGTIVTLDAPPNSPVTLPNTGYFAGGGVRKNGKAGTISGVDGSPSGSCPVAGQADLPGLVTLTDEYGGFQDPLEGDPPLQQVSSSQLSSMASGIDWSNINPQNCQSCTFGSSLSPDVQLTSSNADSLGNYTFGSDDWPVVTIEGSADLSGVNGQGILVVQDALTLNGNVTWDGPVIAGGAITSNGNNTIQGAVASGLNEVFFGQSVAQDDLEDTLNGTKTFQRHACNLWRANLASFGVPTEAEGAWYEDL